MRRDHPVIIEVALNGTTRPATNPNVPVDVVALTRDALACLEAGAQIVHQHDDLGQAGKLGGATPEHMAEQGAALYRAVLDEVPDALLYPTSNWPGDIAARWEHQAILAREGLLKMAYVDPGSVNIAGRNTDGTPRAESSLVYAHSFPDIEWMLARCREHRLAPSLAIFEGGFLRAVRAYEDAGKMPAGALVKLYFGDAVPFGFPPTAAAFEAYLELLADSALPWSVAVLGGDVIESGMALRALRAGGHLRVGLEDYAGPDTPGNRELVERAVALCAEAGRPLATRTETRQLLGMA